MKDIILQWAWFTLILAVYVFGLTALIFKVGHWIDDRRKRKKMANKVYVVSGFFAEAAIGPLHTGHKEYIQSVIDLSKEGDIIIVIVNNAEQRAKKYSNKTICSPYSTNLIIEEIKKTFPNVYVKVSTSNDKTVREDLEKIRWFYDGRKYEVTFVKDGGEYTPDNLPELSVDYINFLFLENEKKDSASDIIADWEKSKEIK